MKYLCKIFVNWNEIKIVNMKLKGGGVYFDKYKFILLVLVKYFIF